MGATGPRKNKAERRLPIISRLQFHTQFQYVTGTTIFAIAAQRLNYWWAELNERELAAY